VSPTLRTLSEINSNLSVTNSARIGCRAFAIAGPSAWNNLQDPVRELNSTETAFQAPLKHFCSHGTSAPRALGCLFGDALNESTH